MSESGKLPPDARTSLRHVGGPTERRGDPALAEILDHAFDVERGDEESARAHVHGFHSYPARLHPVTAARLVRALGEAAATLIDPFCGSGTLVVEGRLAGMRVIGTDVNPLAIRIARLKSRGVGRAERETLVDAVRWVASHVEARRKTQASVTHKYPPEDVELFEPHVLLELDSIRDGLDRVQPKSLREDLELVFSSILTKASRRRGDSGESLEPRRLAPGFVTRTLTARAEELVRQLAEFESLLPPRAPPPDVHSDDARVLGTVRARSADLVVTSPPYPATYDYVAHHDARFRWLRLRIDRFDALELGARRNYTKLTYERARERWDDELGRALGAIERALRPGALAVLVLGDSAVERVALRADAIVEGLAAARSLEVVAIASQPRPHFHSRTLRAFDDAPRREHIVALRKSAEHAPPEVGEQR